MKEYQTEEIPGRIPFTDADRKAALERDKKCRKCGVASWLELHHINPVRDSGTNELDNLIVLCWPCHRDWEIVDTLEKISFLEWLELPNYLTLLGMFLSADQSDEIPWGQVKKLVKAITIVQRNYPEFHFGEMPDAVMIMALQMVDGDTE